MAWHLTKIPKKAHFYWGGNILPWARYLTLFTFKRQNPSWSIEVWRPPVLAPNDGGRDYWNDLGGMMNAAIRRVDVEADILKRPISWTDSPFVRDSYRSDYVRREVLAVEGGMWSDMDVLYYRPITTAFFNHAGADWVDTVYGPACFCLSAPGSSLFVTERASMVSKDFSFENGNYLIECAPPTGSVRTSGDLLFDEVDFDGDRQFHAGPNTIGAHWHGNGVPICWPTEAGNECYTPENVQWRKTMLARAIRYALEAPYGVA